jgi:hypothetical protein
VNRVPRTDRCGTVSGYRDHMQLRTPTCQPCRDIVAAKEVNYRKRIYLARGPMLIDSTGTRRRLQALAAIGWTAQHIGDRMGGFSARHVQMLLTRELVHRNTAGQVAEVFEELSGTPGPSKITRSRAEAKGWAPPLAWDEGQIDDPRAVSHTEIEAAHEAALREVKLRAKRAERAAASARLREDPDRFAEHRARRAAYKREYRARESAA